MPPFPPDPRRLSARDRLGASADSIVARRLRLHTALSAAALQALDRLLGFPIAFPTDALIAEAGDAADLVTVLRDGFVCRMSLLPDGRRQIHSVFLPGDTIDAESPLLGLRPDNIEALTKCSAWLVPKSRISDLVPTQRDLVEAFAREAAIGAQIAREWVVNIGQRTAKERIAHLICELHLRLSAIGLATDDGFVMPLSQQEIADAQGLSAVHVNRVLQELRSEGVIRTERRQLWIVDMTRLRATALFDPLYLHVLNNRS